MSCLNLPTISFSRTKAIPVNRRLKVRLRHEVEEDLGRLIGCSFDRFYLLEEFASLVPVATYIVSETFVENVKERLNNNRIGRRLRNISLT